MVSPGKSKCRPKSDVLFWLEIRGAVGIVTGRFAGSLSGHRKLCVLLGCHRQFYTPGIMSINVGPVRSIRCGPKLMIRVTITEVL